MMHFVNGFSQANPTSATGPSVEDFPPLRPQTLKPFGRDAQQPHDEGAPCHIFETGPLFDIGECSFVHVLFFRSTWFACGLATIQTKENNPCSCQACYINHGKKDLAAHWMVPVPFRGNRREFEGNRTGELEGNLKGI